MKRYIPHILTTFICIMAVYWAWRTTCTTGLEEVMSWMCLCNALLTLIIVFIVENIDV